jgi:hypothetical protein
LLAPFTGIADEAMKAGAARLWNDMESWEGDVESPISRDVWQFMSSVRAARAGGNIS